MSSSPSLQRLRLSAALPLLVGLILPTHARAQEASEEPSTLMETTFSSGLLTLTRPALDLNIVFDELAEESTLWIETRDGSDPRDHVTLVDHEDSVQLAIRDETLLEDDRAVRRLPVLLVDGVVPAGTSLHIFSSLISGTISVRNIGASAESEELATAESEPSDLEPENQQPRAAVELPREAQLATAGTVRANVNESTLAVLGPIGGRLAGRGSSFDVEGTTNQLELRLVNGFASLRHHQGSLSLNGNESRFTVVQADGGATFQLTGGELELSDSSGQVTGVFRGGALRLSGHTGVLDVTGSDYTLSIPDGAQVSRVKAIGKQADMILGEVVGPCELELMGGTLVAEETRATKVTLGDGATAQLSDLPAAVTLDVKGGARATVIDGRGNVQATVVDGRFEATRVPAVRVTAQSAQVSIAEIGTLQGLQVTDTILDLDLSETTGRATTVRVQGQSEAYVRAKTPCFVKLAGASTALSTSLRVTGCEIDSPQQRRRYRRGGLSSMDGGTGMVLTVDVPESSSMQVVGN